MSAFFTLEIPGSAEQAGARLTVLLPMIQAWPCNKKHFTLRMRAKPVLLPECSISFLAGDLDLKRQSTS